MRRALALSAGVLAALPGVAGAQETRASVDVAATGGYSNNPFAEIGNDTSSGFVALDVTPQLRLLTERNTFTISGQAHIQDYFSHYPVTDSYRGSLDWRGHPSARLTTFAHLDLSSAVLGSDDQYAIGNLSGLGTGTVGGTTGTGIGTGTGTATGTGAGAGATSGAGATGGTGASDLPIGTGPLISDIGLLGTRDRRRSLYAIAGGTDALSAHDSLSLSGFVDIARYSAYGYRSNYNGYGGTLGYSRQVSARFSAGIQGSASQYDYTGTQGSTSVYSVQATASGRISQYWTLDGALGVSFINTDALGASDRASLSGNVDLCRQGAYDVVCLQASRQARATGYNGAQYVTSAGASWRHRLSERARLTLDAAYLNEGGLSSLYGVQDQYLRFSATYDHQLRQRLRLLVSARYRNVFGGLAGESADYGGQVGVSYHFGDLR